MRALKIQLRSLFCALYQSVNMLLQSAEPRASYQSVNMLLQSAEPGALPCRRLPSGAYVHQTAETTWTVGEACKASSCGR